MYDKGRYDTDPNTNEAIERHNLHGGAFSTDA